jgi:hypothetical protein
MSKNINTDDLIALRQIVDVFGKQYGTVHAAMNHRKAPAPRLDHHGYQLWDRAEAIAFLKDRGWKFVKG